MRNREEIIRKAAEKSGMPLPLDDETQELTDGLFRGLDDCMAIMKGEKQITGTKKTEEWIKNLIKETEEMRSERRHI